MKPTLVLKKNKTHKQNTAKGEVWLLSGDLAQTYIVKHLPLSFGPKGITCIGSAFVHPGLPVGKKTELALAILLLLSYPWGQIPLS